MQILYSKNFLKQYYKLPKKTQDKFKSRQELLVQDPTAPLLRVHALSGKYRGFSSINVTGDVRALFRYEENNTIVFFGYIGTHSQLYG